MNRKIMHSDRPLVLMERVPDGSDNTMFVAFGRDGAVRLETTIKDGVATTELTAAMISDICDDGNLMVALVDNYNGLPRIMAETHIIVVASNEEETTTFDHLLFDKGPMSP